MKLSFRKVSLIIATCVAVYLFFNTVILHPNSYELQLKNIFRDERKLDGVNKIEKLSNLFEKTHATKYSFPFCSCTRVGLKLDKGSNKFNESTCSDFSTQRGSKQKVISYSYYNPTTNYEKGSFHSQKYLKTLLDRANEIKAYYPEWFMRLYHNISTEDHQGQEVLCDLFCNEPHVDLCDVRNLPTLGNLHEKQAGSLWRFIVMGDPTVSIFSSRDSDSVIQQREVDAVNEWLKSNKTFHVMRDHPNHRAVILAGLWGCKNEKREKEFVLLRNKLLSQKLNHKYGYDQYLLATVVWPTAKKDVLQHDSFTCEIKSHLNSVPFPTKRTNDLYVGWGVVGKEDSLRSLRLSTCPFECRPAQHKDWKKC